MGIPAISYRATVNEYYDYGFYRLPNMLSHQCFSLDELRIILGKILSGELGAADGDERKELLEHHMTAHHGRMACERIIDVLEETMNGHSEPLTSTLPDRFKGWCTANARRLIKRVKAYLPGTHAPPEFHRHRYPGISLEELDDRIRRFQKQLGYEEELRVKQLYAHVFQITP